MQIKFMQSFSVQQNKLVKNTKTRLTESEIEIFRVCEMSCMGEKIIFLVIYLMIVCKEVSTK